MDPQSLCAFSTEQVFNKWFLNEDIYGRSGINRMRGNSQGQLTMATPTKLLASVESPSNRSAFPFLLSPQLFLHPWAAPYLHHQVPAVPTEPLQHLEEEVGGFHQVTKERAGLESLIKLPKESQEELPVLHHVEDVVCKRGREGDGRAGLGSLGMGETGGAGMGRVRSGSRGRDGRTSDQARPHS